MKNLAPPTASSNQMGSIPRVYYFISSFDLASCVFCARPRGAHATFTNTHTQSTYPLDRTIASIQFVVVFLNALYRSTLVYLYIALFTKRKVKKMCLNGQAAGLTVKWGKHRYDLHYDFIY